LSSFVNLFVICYIYNIEKYRINVNTNSVYLIFQITWVLTDDERFVIFEDMELLEDIDV